MQSIPCVSRKKHFGDMLVIVNSVDLKSYYFVRSKLLPTPYAGTISCIIEMKLKYDDEDNLIETALPQWVSRLV